MQARVTPTLKPYPAGGQGACGKVWVAVQADVCAAGELWTALNPCRQLDTRRDSLWAGPEYFGGQSPVDSQTLDEGLQSLRRQQAEW